MLHRIKAARPLKLFQPQFLQRFLWGPLVQDDRDRFLAQLKIEQLHPEREGHGEVNIAFVDVLMRALRDERHPNQEQKDSASIFNVGCSCTKSLIASAYRSITPSAITTAVIITQSVLAIPIAVITESREKTMSSSRICTMTALNLAGPFSAR